MDQRVRAVIADIDDLIAALRRPLSAQDREAGWDDGTRAAWQAHFEGLHARLAGGEAPQDEQYHLMRWLNFDGIGEGPLADRMGAIQRELWELFADDEARSWWENGTSTGREARRFLRELGVEQRSRLRTFAERVASRFAKPS